MLVQDVMTANPVTTSPQVPLQEALEQMQSLRVRHLPVVQDNQLVGVVTWTDILRAALPPLASGGAERPPLLPHDLTVSEVMTREVITISPGATVEEAATLLRRHRIGCLPVLDREQLVGIVTKSDLFDALVYLRGGDLDGVRLSVALPGGLEDLHRLVQALRTLQPDRWGLVLSVRLDGVIKRADLCAANVPPLVLAEHLAAAGLHPFHLRFRVPTKSR
ncbi:MAG: CBS domain-containing protein [Armatimonadota bacterium]|nr:CBS domain-containing protein [Armatimonadota bacterium]MDR7440087.1 CBS domain-containing protein [Armatimonadota bacterium]MDR7563575.1 CBS domain-containing protein [Armatimonadota bacterium]MDR7568237.1 CBS domain-containing protein [Armatimonadota bacterium]MDR7602187.1 CBS domain-containing protein [Armatimonadota bacterium]